MSYRTVEEELKENHEKLGKLSEEMERKDVALNEVNKKLSHENKEKTFLEKENLDLHLEMKELKKLLMESPSSSHTSSIKKLSMGNDADTNPSRTPSDPFAVDKVRSFRRFRRCN